MAAARAGWRCVFVCFMTLRVYSFFLHMRHLMAFCSLSHDSHHPLFQIFPSFYLSEGLVSLPWEGVKKKDGKIQQCKLWSTNEKVILKPDRKWWMLPSGHVQIANALGFILTSFIIGKTGMVPKESTSQLTIFTIKSVFCSWHLSLLIIFLALRIDARVNLMLYYKTSSSDLYFFVYFGGGCCCVSKAGPVLTLSQGFPWVCKLLTLAYQTTRIAVVCLQAG